MGIRNNSQRRPIQGMTLHEYANTTGWGQVSSNSTRVTAPIWRKTRQQRVDEKINKLEAAFAES